MTDTADPILIRLTDPGAPEALALLADYSRFLAQHVTAEGTDAIPLPLADAARYRAPQGAMLVAFDGTDPVACVCLRALSPGLGEVKRLYVTPAARGRGLARRMMEAIEDQARALGMTRLNLDTNEALTPALALYRGTGWIAIAPYTDFPATHWFSKPL